MKSTTFAAAAVFLLATFVDAAGMASAGDGFDESIHDLRGSSRPNEVGIDGYTRRELEDKTASGFLWRLWYEKGIKWERRGTEYCVQCAGKDGCTENGYVMTNYCNPNDVDQRWEYVEVKNNAGQIKVMNKDLCLTRLNKRQYKLEKCDKSRHRQLYTGFKYDGKFALRPYKRENRCITMHHHPRAKYEFNGEIIYSQPCHKPNRTETVYWNAEFRDEVEERIVTIDFKCNKYGRCGECQGICKTDNDCRGHLKCWHRNEFYWRIGLYKGWDTAWSKIPGCQGMGKFGWDYCYDPNKREPKL